LFQIQHGFLTAFDDFSCSCAKKEVHTLVP
jgi:hypothetical protein